jgi:hypothetical protein
MSTDIIGHKWKVDFGQFAFQLAFDSETSMSFRPIQPGGGLGEATTVEISRTELRPDLWLVSWDEPSNGATVVHVQDYENGKVWTHISMFGEKLFMRELGALTAWESAA